MGRCKGKVMFGFFKHKHEWLYCDLGTGPMRHKVIDGVGIGTARGFNLKFCKCGKFEVNMGGEEGSRLSGHIPYSNEVSSHQILDLLKDLSYDLSMTFGEECNNYVI